MYYPNTALTPTSGATVISGTAAAPGGANTLAAMGSTTGITHTGHGHLTGYTHAPTAGSLNGLNGISTGINGLATAGLSGGLAAMSTTALMGTMGAKWMLPDWSVLGLGSPLVSYKNTSFIVYDLATFICALFSPFTIYLNSITKEGMCPRL